jgi:chromosome segregation ATPase
MSFVDAQKTAFFKAVGFSCPVRVARSLSMDKRFDTVSDKFNLEHNNLYTRAVRAYRDVRQAHAEHFRNQQTSAVQQAVEEKKHKSGQTAERTQARKRRRLDLDELIQERYRGDLETDESLENVDEERKDNEPRSVSQVRLQREADEETTLLKGKLASSEAETKSLRNELAAQETQAQALRDKLATRDSENDELRAQLHRLRTEFAAEKETLQTKVARMEQTLRSAKAASTSTATYIA